MTTALARTGIGKRGDRASLVRAGGRDARVVGRAGGEAELMATYSPPCTPESHAAIQANAHAFARNTVFVSACGDNELVHGQCIACGLQLTLSLAEWTNEDTEVVERKGGAE